MRKPILPIQPVLGLTLAVSATLLCLPAFSPASAAGNSKNTSKLPVSDTKIAANRTLVTGRTGALNTKQPGIRLVEEYGAFGLYLVNDNLINGLEASGRAHRVPSTVEFAEFTIDANDPDLSAIPAALRVDKLSGEGMLLIRFIGPIKDRWLEAMAGTGLKAIHYVANNAYLAWSDDAGRERLSQLPQSESGIQFTLPHQPYFKLSRVLRELALGGGNSSDAVPVVIQLLEHPGIAETEAFIRSRQIDVLAPEERVGKYRNLTLSLPIDALIPIASRQDVTAIQPRLEPELLDEVQGQVVAGNLNATQSGPSGPGYRAWLASLGGSANPSDYPIVAIVDDVIGDGTVSSGDRMLHELGSELNPTRLFFNNHCTTSIASSSIHGHIDASIAGGYDDTIGSPYTDGSGYQLGLGISPYGRFAGTQIFKNNTFDGLIACGSSFSGLIWTTWTSGAEITNNSWGGVDPTYTVESQTYDRMVRDADPTTEGNQQQTMIFSAGNEGPTAETIRVPSNGKNVITVGASRKSSSAMNITGFSSRGPAPGNRVKPEVVAPGNTITGSVKTPWYTGAYLTSSSGTSQAAPSISAAASLYSEFIHRKYGLKPSPALLKAHLIAHTTYLTGTGANDTLPSNSQGYGRPNLGAGLDPDTSRILHNQTYLFQNTGEVWSMDAEVVDAAKPLRITLAYTDQEGAVGTSPQVNNLDLEVDVGGVTYLGNVFTGQWSVSGGAADDKNNYEAVFLPAGATGPITIRVLAANIAGDGVPGNADATDQDFALVCYNCGQGVTLDVAPASLALCSPGTGSASVSVDRGTAPTDPGDVTLSAGSLPAGITAGFTPNPVTPTGGSLMDLTLAGGVTTGHYDISIAGAPTAGPNASASLAIDVYNAVPAIPILLIPSNGASVSTPSPSFAWQDDPNVAAWTIEIATDAAFSNIIHSATISAASYSLPDALPVEQTYYWRVSASNGCGSGGSSGFSFNVPLMYCSSDKILIGDNNYYPVISTQTITRLGKLSDLNLSVRASHSYVGDLAISLTHQQMGSSVILIDEPGIPATAGGCGGDNIDATLDDEAATNAEDACSGVPPALQGTLRPNNPLAAFDGEVLGGDWTLTVTDHYAGDVGVLEGWCLIPSFNRAGDFNSDGCIDRTDYNIINTAIRGGTTDMSYDLNGDGKLNIGDNRALVTLYDYPLGASCP